MVCGHPVVHIAPAPPAPIIARTGCGTYEIQPDGSVHSYASNWAPAWAPRAVSRPAPGVWVAHPDGQLAVYRAGRLLWQSKVRPTNDAVILNGNTIAFEVWGPRTPESFWIARVGKQEHRVSYGEDPIGWTANGLLTQRGDKLVLRAASGRAVRVFGDMHAPIYDAADRTVIAATQSGAVVRTDGLHIWRLARGFRANAWVQLVGDRVIEVTTGRRAVFLRSDGSQLGTTGPVYADRTFLDVAVALPNNRGVVYVVRHYRPDSDPGVNFVYTLRPRARPRLLYKRRIPSLSCGEGTSLSYSAGHLLYVDSEGPIAVLDPRGRARPVDLTPAFSALQPRKTYLQQLGADWAANWR